MPTRPARSAGLTLVKLVRSATLKLSASTALVPARPAALKLARLTALKLAAVTIVELARPAALVPAGPTRGSVGIVAKADKALLKRCDDLVHQALVLGAFLVSKAVEAVVLVGHVVHRRRLLAARVGEAHHGDATVLGGLLPRYVALVLELGEQLGQRLLAHVQQVRELALGGLGLGGKQREYAALAAQRVAHRPLDACDVHAVAMQQHPQPSCLAVQRYLLVVKLLCLLPLFSLHVLVPFLPLAD